MLERTEGVREALQLDEDSYNWKVGKILVYDILCRVHTDGFDIAAAAATGRARA